MLSASQGTVEDKRFKRSSASQMEFHASKKRNCGHVGRGFCPSIEALAGADNRRQIVQADYLSKAE